MRMLRAHVEGIHFLKTQKEASLKILAKYLRTNDRELLEGSYEIYNRDFIAAPYPIVSGLKTMIASKRFRNSGRNVPFNSCSINIVLMRSISVPCFT